MKKIKIRKNIAYRAVSPESRRNPNVLPSLSLSKELIIKCLHTTINIAMSYYGLNPCLIKFIYSDSYFFYCNLTMRQMIALALVFGLFVQDYQAYYVPK